MCSLEHTLSCFKICIRTVADNDMWFQPECTGSGSDGNVGPSPRAFHIAVSIDCNMFIFGGRSGGKRYLVNYVYEVYVTYLPTKYVQIRLFVCNFDLQVR